MAEYKHEERKAGSKSKGSKQGDESRRDSSPEEEAAQDRPSAWKTGQGWHANFCRCYSRAHEARNAVKASEHCESDEIAVPDAARTAARNAKHCVKSGKKASAHQDQRHISEDCGGSKQRRTTLQQEDALAGAEAPKKKACRRQVDWSESVLDATVAFKFPSGPVLIKASTDDRHSKRHAERK
jgi:hypothetical protein